MFDLKQAVQNLGANLCHVEAEMLSSAHSLVAHIYQTISTLEAQPALISTDMAKLHDRALTDIMSWCAAHLRKSPERRDIGAVQKASAPAGGSGIDPLSQESSPQSTANAASFLPTAAPNPTTVPEASQQPQAGGISSPTLPQFGG